MTPMTPADTLRLIILVLSIVGFFVWVRWLVRDCALRWIAIAPLSWLINLTAFYLVRQLELPVPIMTLNLWSSAIQLHGLILLIAAGVTLCQRSS